MKVKFFRRKKEEREVFRLGEILRVIGEGKSHSRSEEENPLRSFGNIFHLNGYALHFSSSDPRLDLIADMSLRASSEDEQLILFTSPSIEKWLLKELRLLKEKGLQWEVLPFGEEALDRFIRERFATFNRGERILVFLPLVHYEFGLRIPLARYAKIIRDAAKKYRISHLHIHADFSHALFEEKLNFFSYRIDSMQFSLPLHSHGACFASYYKKQDPTFSTPCSSKEHSRSLIHSALELFRNSREVRERGKKLRLLFETSLQNDGVPEGTRFLSQEHTDIQEFISVLSFSTIDHEELLIRLEEEGVYPVIGEVCRDIQFRSLTLNMLNLPYENALSFTFHPSIHNEKSVKRVAKRVSALSQKLYRFRNSGYTAWHE